jgi:large subunit ribosomal protein L28
MAQVCDICGRGPQFGNTISHAHNVSRRRWNINLRPVRAKVKGGAKRMRVCTSCLRSGKVVKALDPNKHEGHEGSGNSSRRFLL